MEYHVRWVCVQSSCVLGVWSHTIWGISNSPSLPMLQQVFLMSNSSSQLTLSWGEMHPKLYRSGSYSSPVTTSNLPVTPLQGSTGFCNGALPRHSLLLSPSLTSVLNHVRGNSYLPDTQLLLRQWTAKEITSALVLALTWKWYSHDFSLETTLKHLFSNLFHVITLFTSGKKNPLLKSKEQ